MQHVLIKVECWAKEGMNLHFEPESVVEVIAAVSVVVRAGNDNDGGDPGLQNNDKYVKKSLSKGAAHLLHVHLDRFSQLCFASDSENALN